MTNEQTTSYVFKSIFCVVIGLVAKKLLELSAEVVGCWYFYMSKTVKVIFEHLHITYNLLVTFNCRIVKF